MTRIRTSSERQGEVLRLEGPYPLECDTSKTGAPRATDPGTEGPLRKVKRVNKPQKKEPKKIGEKKKKLLVDAMLGEELQQNDQQVEDTPNGGRRQTTTATRARVITARNLAQMMEGPSWMVRPDVYCTGLYKGELPTLTVSELMEWDREEGIINRAFTNQLVTMEPIDFLEGLRGSNEAQTMLEDLRLEDVNVIRRSIKGDAFDKVLPEDYKRLRDYLGLVGPSTGDELVAECRGLLGRNLGILYQIVGLDPNDSNEWTTRMRSRESLGNADVRTQQITERIRILAESILDNKRYTGQESRRRLYREVSIAIFTEMVRSLAATGRGHTDEWTHEGGQEERGEQRLHVFYPYNSLLDTAETLDILDRMEGEEKNTWEDLVEETEQAASWARRINDEEEAGPLLVTKQLLASQIIEESEWLQRRAATGKTKSKDLAEIAVLKEHQLCVEAITERYGKILWRNGGSIPEPLRGLALAITRTNRQMIETIERARKKARRSKRRRRGDTPPPCRDSRGRTRSARSQASRMPEEDQVQGREISYSPVTEEDDVEERTITQDVPYINEETERNEELKRNEESRRNDEVKRRRYC